MLKKQFLTAALLVAAYTNAQVIEVTSSNFNQEVKENSKLVVLDTYATWCGPCQEMKPIFETVSQQFEGKVVFAKMDIDRAPKIAEKLNVEIIPTFYIFYKGNVIEKIVGSQSKEKLIKIVEKHIQSL